MVASKFRRQKTIWFLAHRLLTLGPHFLTSYQNLRLRWYANFCCNILSHEVWWGVWDSRVFHAGWSWSAKTLNIARFVWFWTSETVLRFTNNNQKRVGSSQTPCNLHIATQPLKLFQHADIAISAPEVVRNTWENADENSSVNIGPFWFAWHAKQPEDLFWFSETLTRRFWVLQKAQERHTGLPQLNIRTLCVRERGFDRIILYRSVLVGKTLFVNFKSFLVL